MNKQDSLNFLQNCIDRITNASDEDIEMLRMKYDMHCVRTLLVGGSMNKTVIDYRENNAKQKLKEALDKWIESDADETLEVQLIHVVSGDFEEDFDLEETTDFNGWQCDWWNSLDYNGYRFNLYGEAWYGRILITS